MGDRVERKAEELVLYTPPPPPKTRAELYQEQQEKAELSMLLSKMVLGVIVFVVFIFILSGMSSASQAKSYTPVKQRTYTKPTRTKKPVVKTKKVEVVKPVPFISGSAFNNYFSLKKAMSRSDRISLKGSINRLNKKGNKVVAIRFIKGGKVKADLESGKSVTLKNNMRFKKWLRTRVKKKPFKLIG